MGKGRIFSKEAFEKVRQKKIEVERYRKHKMLKQYEKICRSEGLTSSNRIPLAGSASTDKGEKAEQRSKSPAFHEKQRAVATAARADMEQKRAEDEAEKEKVKGLVADRQKRQERFSRMFSGKRRKLGMVSVDIVQKLTKGK